MNWKLTIGQYKSKLDQRIGKCKAIEQSLRAKQKAFNEADSELEYTEEAMVYAQEVAKQTQEQLKVHIEDIITMALESILDEPYSFELDFVTRRNKTECDVYFVRDGKRVNPIDASGGGAVDIASFAARIALWSLSGADNVLVFDEPFRYVSANYQARVGELLTKISKQLNLQVIMVTHNPQYIQQADTVLTVTHSKGVSSCA